MIRNQRVMLSSDLAELYQVSTKSLTQAVKRNIRRFPSDFMFSLSPTEWENLRSQFVTSSSSHGGTRYTPMAFTEQSVAMLSTVLRSPVAIDVNIEIIRDNFFKLFAISCSQTFNLDARLALSRKHRT